jgi:hypothetical protein
VLSVVVIGTLLLLASRWLNRRSRYGPLRLTDVVLSGSDDDEQANARATASIRALIMECLQLRRVQAHGVIPSYSGIDARATDLQGGPVYPKPANLLTRVSVALIQSSVIDQGFSVTVTQTPAQPPFTVGLSFTIQRVSTGARARRRLLVDQSRRGSAQSRVPARGLAGITPESGLAPVTP